MNRKAFKNINVLMALIIVSFEVSFNHKALLSYFERNSDPVKELKQKINKARMLEYVDSLHGARLLYPDFFVVDSVGKNYASFSYSDKNVKDLNLFYFKYPPRLIENPKEMARSCTDSLTKYTRVKDGSFIEIQEYEYFPQIKCIFKFYKTQHGWTSYILTYDKRYEDAVERLIKMTMDWKVYDEDIPKWLTDLCDFLDI